MPAETLRCPSCGAAVSSAATRCDFCKAVLATVTCPSCFGVMFAGAKFCSHCGARGNRTELAAGDARLCPRCQVGMKSVAVGTSSLLECVQCEGIWVDLETLQQICTDREKQALVSATPSTLDQPLQFEKAIRYVRCPVCHDLMNRVQFARCSHVVVDVCKSHGTWFDRDELCRAVQFVQAGGMEKARAQQRKLDASRLYAPFFDPAPSGPGDDTRINGATSTIGFLFDLFK